MRCGIGDNDCDTDGDVTGDVSGDWNGVTMDIDTERLSVIDVDDDMAAAAEAAAAGVAERDLKILRRRRRPGCREGLSAAGTVAANRQRLSSWPLREDIHM